MIKDAVKEEVDYYKKNIFPKGRHKFTIIEIIVLSLFVILAIAHIVCSFKDLTFLAGIFLVLSLLVLIAIWRIDVSRIHSSEELERKEKVESERALELKKYLDSIYGEKIDENINSLIVFCEEEIASFDNKENEDFDNLKSIGKILAGIAVSLISISSLNDLKSFLEISTTETIEVALLVILCLIMFFLILFSFYTLYHSYKGNDVFILSNLVIDLNHIKAKE